MDIKIANWIFNTFGTNKTLAVISKIITFFGDFYTIVCIITLLLLFKKTRKIGFYAGIAVLITFVLNEYALKNIVKRDRPFIKNEQFLQMLTLANYQTPAGYSMASGHSAVTMCLAVSVFLFNKKAGSLAIVISIFCGITRMMLCVHYLTDVLVGFALGTAFAIGFHYLINYLTRKYLIKKGDKNENNSASNSE